MFNNSFFSFVFGFTVIIALAFGVLYFVTSNSKPVDSIDTVAHPR
jgi:hypothetical protein